MMKGEIGTGIISHIMSLYKEQVSLNTVSSKSECCDQFHKLKQAQGYLDI